MTEAKTPTRSKEYMIVFVSVCVITMMSGTVANAYAVQLAVAPGAPGELRQLKPFSSTFFGSTDFLKVEPSPAMRLPQGKAFFSQLATAMHSKTHRVLWSSYPASIRGQTFSGITKDDVSPLDVGTSSAGW